MESPVKKKVRFTPPPSPPKSAVPALSPAASAAVQGSGGGGGAAAGDAPSSAPSEGEKGHLPPSASDRDLVTAFLGTRRSLGGPLEPSALTAEECRAIRRQTEYLSKVVVALGLAPEHQEILTDTAAQYYMRCVLARPEQLSERKAQRHKKSLACLFLAGKFEDVMVRADRIVRNGHRVNEKAAMDMYKRQLDAAKRSGEPPSEKMPAMRELTIEEQNERVEDLARLEREVLVELGFQVHTEHALHQVQMFCTRMGSVYGDDNRVLLWPSIRAEGTWPKSREFTQFFEKAVAAANQTKRTLLPLKYSSRVLALGAMRLAEKLSRFVIMPVSAEGDRTGDRLKECWWKNQEKCENIENELVAEVARELASLFNVPEGIEF